MDKLEPFQVFLLEYLEFSPNYYEVYQGGKLIDSGRTSMAINVRVKDKTILEKDNIVVNIKDNNLSHLLDSCSCYDMVMTLHDRFIAIILPKYSNIDDIMFHTFPMMVQYTRDSKTFAEKEPLCMSMFTSNGNVVKMSFKVYSPETLIELSI